MNFKIRSKKSISWLVVLLTLTIVMFSSCEMDHGDDIVFSELGTETSEYILPEIEGSLEIEVLTDQPFLLLKVIDDVDWLKLPSRIDSSTEVGSMKFNLDYEENEGFRRMASVAVIAPEVGRSDTLYIKQKGANVPTMQFQQSSQQILGSASTVLADLETNIALEDLTIDVLYTGGYTGEDWINNDFTIENNEFLKFSYLANPSETALRNAKISLSYVDGWGDKIVSELFLTQANANDEFGERVTFSELRMRAGEVITDYLFIEGHIISDAGNMNVGDNPNTTPTNIDYTLNDKTAYIQTLDGSMGFKIVTKSVDDNIFKRYSTVTLLVKDTSIEYEDNPGRYTITGVTSDMVLSTEIGSIDDIVTKEKHVKDLIDDDIFTQVKLKDLEFPIRKGPLTPINEGYSREFNAHRISKYPQLMRDINGNSIYLLTNTTCPYRRDGSTLPYGSGDVTGVIVHETFTRYNYEDTDNEDTYGNIGRYQIRHLTKEEINLETDYNRGFSQFLAEYRYFKVDNGVVVPTIGNGKLTSTAPDAVISAPHDYPYLGAIGAQNMGNLTGNGVITEEGDRLSVDAATNNDGKGSVSSADKSAWQSRSEEWWNYEKNRGEAWLIEFSTASVTKQLSLQFSTINWQAVGAPRYWNVEWSLHGDMDRDWNHVDSYTVPDVSNWSNTLMHQLPAHKVLDFLLPTEMLGNEKVFIRLIVAENLASDGQSYASSPISTTWIGNGLSYLSIRYNK